ANSFLPSAPRSTGVTSPPSVATAIDMSTDRYVTRPSSLQVTLASGTSPKAAAAAATTKSLTDTFTGPVFTGPVFTGPVFTGPVFTDTVSAGLEFAGTGPADRASLTRCRSASSSSTTGS